MSLQFESSFGSPSTKHDTQDTAAKDLEIAASTCVLAPIMKHDAVEPGQLDDSTSPSAESEGSGKESDKTSNDGESEVGEDNRDKPVFDVSTSSNTSSSTLSEDTTTVVKPKKSKKDKNARNTLIFDLPMDERGWLEEWGKVEMILHYKFKNPLLLREAMYTLNTFTARLEIGVLLTQSNFPIAQHGDAVLRHMLLDFWFGRTESNGLRTTKGDMQDRLARFISDRNLIKVANTHGITPLIWKWYPRGAAKNPSEKAIGTTVEALIGAVDLDSGHDREVVRRLIMRLLDVNLEDDQWPSSANDRALTLTAQLGRGDDMDVGTLLRLGFSIALQPVKKACKVLGTVKEIAQVALCPWRWRAVFSVKDGEKDRLPDRLLPNGSLVFSSRK